MDRLGTLLYQYEIKPNQLTPKQIRKLQLLLKFHNTYFYLTGSEKILDVVEDLLLRYKGYGQAI